MSFIQPKVSVIVPIYNVEKYLRECLDSLINQTLQEMEIILVDDGSPDNCPQICVEYARKDKRIKVIHKHNGGYGSAMNVGLENATGEYIGIVESDDWVDPNMFEKLYQRAVYSEADVVKGAYYTVTDTLNDKKAISSWIVKISKKYESITLAECPEFVSHHASIWSGIYKTSMLKENNIKFVDDIRPFEDLPYIANVYSKAKKITILAEPLYFYRADAVGSSMNTVKKTSLNYIKQRERSRKIYLANGLFEGDLKEFWWLIAYLGSVRFLNMPNNPYRKDFYQLMNSLYKKAFDDKCSFKYFIKSHKRDFKKISKQNYYYYQILKLVSSIIKKIFSITNINNTHKQICLLGIKIKIKRNKK